MLEKSRLGQAFGVRSTQMLVEIYNSSELVNVLFKKEKKTFPNSAALNIE